MRLAARRGAPVAIAAGHGQSTATAAAHGIRVGSGVEPRPAARPCRRRRQQRWRQQHPQQHPQRGRRAAEEGPRSPGAPPPPKSPPAFLHNMSRYVLYSFFRFNNNNHKDNKCENYYVSNFENSVEP